MAGNKGLIKPRTETPDHRSRLSVHCAQNELSLGENDFILHNWLYIFDPGLILEKKNLGSKFLFLYLLQIAVKSIFIKNSKMETIKRQILPCCSCPWCLHYTSEHNCTNTKQRSLGLEFLFLLKCDWWCSCFKYVMWIWPRIWYLSCLEWRQHFIHCDDDDGCCFHI